MLVISDLTLVEAVLVIYNLPLMEAVLRMPFWRNQ